MRRPLERRHVHGLFLITIQLSYVTCSDSARVLLSTASFYLRLFHEPARLVICHNANNACPEFPKIQQ